MAAAGVILSFLPAQKTGVKVWPGIVAWLVLSAVLSLAVGEVARAADAWSPGLTSAETQPHEQDEHNHGPAGGEGEHAHEGRSRPPRKVSWREMPSPYPVEGSGQRR